jgi:hypothetical protein
MQHPWIRAGLAILAFAAFAGTSLLAQVDISHFPLKGFADNLLIRFAGRRPQELRLFLYAMVHIGIFGCLVPLILAWRMKLPLKNKTSGARLGVGLALALAVALLALHRSGLTWSIIPFRGYQPFTKYLFYLSALGLAIFLHGFYLLPSTLAGLSKGRLRRTLLAAAGCSVALYCIKELEILPLGVTPPDELVWYGMAVFACELIAGSPATALLPVALLSFALCFPARGEWISTAWKPTLAVFLISFWSFCLYLSTKNKGRFPPGQDITPKAS